MDNATLKEEEKMRNCCMQLASHKKFHACSKRCCSQVVKRTARQCRKLESRLLARLYSLLRRLPPTQRRSVLEARLVEDQRLALESWMLSRRCCRSLSTSRRVESKLMTSRKDTFQLEDFISCQAKSWQPKVSMAPHALSRESCFTNSRSISRHVLAQHQKTNACPQTQAASIVAQSRDTKLGVMCNMQKGGCYYSAQLSIGSLRLMSKADRNLGTVLQFRDVLLAIRQRLLPVSTLIQADYDDFEKRFRDAISDTLGEWKLDAISMGLRFKVCIRPLWISKPLCTPTYSIAEHLDIGLNALRRLHAVRRNIQHRSYLLRVKTLTELTEEWSALREAYTEIMLDAGRHRSKVEATLDQLQSEFFKQQNRKTQDMNRARMVAEEMHQAALRRQERKCRLDRQKITNRSSRLESKLDGLLKQWAYLDGHTARDVLQKSAFIARKRSRCDILAQLS